MNTNVKTSAIVNVSMDKEIIDNETGRYQMSQFLNDLLPNSCRPVSIATGYFNVEGYELVREALNRAMDKPGVGLRLLLGSESVTKRGVAGRMDAYGGGDAPLAEELEQLSIEEKYARLVDDLIAFLKRENVEVRTNPNKFCHAKAYILDSHVAVGSSNFTKAGLSTNVELNAVLYQPSAQQLVRDWFERRWANAESSKDQLIQVLEESKFGFPLDPYTMYMKFLYEYYKPRLEELERERGRIIELATFQQDAVGTALRIIRKYNGVIIADSTGLGKTHIGIELLREFVAVKRMKALVIAPAQVLDTVWEKRLLDESIKTKNLTLESTGTSGFNPEDYLDFDVVLIDESHNYRNASTNRYANLTKLLSGGKRKKVILMTATPVNNTLIDLYHQLSLITSKDDAHFAELGIPDLRKHFLLAERKELSQGIEDIVRILDEIMIRRTRQFIKENYPDARINDRPIKFPVRRIVKREYSLTQLFGGGVYRQVLDVIDNLNLVPYRTDYYRLVSDEKDRCQAEVRGALQKIFLLKRFESSIEAIKKSISRLIDFYRIFDKAMGQGMILDSRQFHKLIMDADAAELEDEEKLLESIKGLPLRPLTDEYDRGQIRKDLDYDLGLLEPLMKNLGRILPYTDHKLSTLIALLSSPGVLDSGGRKCIIFTQYKDTAKYLHGELTKALDGLGKNVKILTGDTDPKTRERIINEFAPKANNAAFVTNQIDVLISTDILSEGQNLQDANYVVNYDLPWNPMKMVQRVGRVDRLNSDYDTVTSAVFLPESELEELLHLKEKLEDKIQKASQTVGVEATILGEKENPKNFNALDRIRKEDITLIDDMERAAELLPVQGPFQHILAYLRTVGSKSLESIPFGKGSGKRSDTDGVVLFYRERGSLEGIHLIHYNPQTGGFDHYNDVSWVFRKISCREDEKLWLPSEYGSYRVFNRIDSNARDQVVRLVNTPLDLKGAQRIKAKNQRELAELIFNAYQEGRISGDEGERVYDILQSGNLVAWEDEFYEILSEYKARQDIKAAIASLEQLFKKYQLEARSREAPRELLPGQLEVVGYIFLGGKTAGNVELW